MIDPADHIESVARLLLGEPNARLSTKTQLRYGTHGSLSIEIAGEAKGTWFDHEANSGGGVLDLIQREKGLANGAAMDWLKAELRLEDGARRERRILATYDYRDERGELRYQVVRLEPKDFRQRRPAADGWEWSIKGLEPLPYRLPDMLASAGGPVFVVEGEKDADALAALGLVATCNSGGAGKWAPGLSRWLRGRKVYILPDNDDAGRKHAEIVARELRGVAAFVAICPLPGLPPKGDVSDWLAAGGDREQLLELCRRAGEAEPPSRFGTVTWGEIDFDARQTSYLVKRLLSTTAMSVVYGESGCGKTFVAMDIALHVALGWDWRGRKVKRAGVLYLALEGGLLGSARRIAAFRRHHRRDIDDDVPFAVVPSAVNLLAPEVDVEDLITEVRRLSACMAEPIALIVVDTLSRALAGGRENTPEDMGSFVRNVDRLRQETGAHVLIVHHSGKDRAAGARGHSLLRAATDTEIEIAKDDEAGIATATVRKQRDDGAGDAFAFRLEPVPLGYDADGDEVTSCVVVEAEAEPSRRGQPKLSDRQRLALKALDDCLLDAGKPTPGGAHYPQGVRVVSKDLWRSYLFKAGVLDEEAANPRSDFKKLFDALCAKKCMGAWGDLLWKA